MRYPENRPTIKAENIFMEVLLEASRPPSLEFAVRLLEKNPLLPGVSKVG